MNLSDAVSAVKGIGPKTAAVLEKVGIQTVRDLLLYFPRAYVVYEDPLTTADLKEGYHITLDGCIRGSLRVKRNGKKSVTVGIFADLFGEVQVVWFNMAYIKRQVVPGRRILLRGRVRRNGTRLEIEQPEIFAPEAYEKKKSVLQPVYSLTAGLKNALLVRALRECLAQPALLDALPPLFHETQREAYGLLSLQEAVPAIHFPRDTFAYESARRTLVFSEFFLFLISLRLEKTAQAAPVNAFPCSRHGFAQTYLEQLPFTLTEGQASAWQEILADLAGKNTMNRLIQGDVGSGKTVLAVLSLLTAAENGYQGVLMAPTEVLARQHFQTVSEQLRAMGLPLRPLLLVGSMTEKEKKEAAGEIESGRAQLIIGTHALIQEKVRYRNVALVITDEQHRFGVKQREALQSKGKKPHVLVMSATPIPRTLALILYGDLSVSLIRQLPKERLPVKNCVVGTAYRKEAYRFILREIEAGHQAYIICPLVEKSEEIDGENVTDTVRYLQTVFPPAVRIGLLHGRLKAEEKNAVMEAFAENKIRLLVSTTVVEVGVNVPNATVMMVENAECFGLSTLHQLRGRVGRGKAQSYCIFIDAKGRKETARRLSVLENTNDGFELAEKDLQLRGPGEMLGIKQSGDLGFRLADVVADAAVLKEADAAVKAILTADPKLESRENEAMLSAVRALGKARPVL